MQFARPVLRTRGLTTLSHQLLSKTESSMCPHDAQRCDVPVLYAVCRVFFHFR